MKFFSASLTALLLCGNCLAGEDAVTNSAKDAARSYSLRHAKKGVRLDGKPDSTDIKPVAPASGITTGLVVVYGHVIKPPYKFSVEGNAISINSVPVGKMATEEAVLTAKAEELIEKANALFCAAASKKSGDGKAAEILALFERNRDVVISAKWIKNEPPPKGVLIVDWKEGVHRPDVRFNKGSCRAQAAVAARARHNAAAMRKTDGTRQAANLQKALERGDMLFFASDGSHAVLPPAIKTQILGALKEEGITRKEMTAKLESSGLPRRTALDVARNSTPAEWKALK